VLSLGKIARTQYRCDSGKIFFIEEYL